MSLIRKDFIVDWRQQNPIMGTLLYIVTTIFTSYMVFRGVISLEMWNVFFWIILLFTTTTAIAKSFIQEEKRTLYYFFLAYPSEIIISKLVYSFLYLISIVIISLVIYMILFGNPVIHWTLFALNLLFGCIGLSSAFTMVSAIAFRTSNRSVMMAILGFPVIIPVMVLSISNAINITNGYIWQEIQGNMWTLMSVDVIIIVLTFALFPFIWKS